jgi:hypothetical protein
MNRRIRVVNSPYSASLFEKLAHSSPSIILCKGFRSIALLTVSLSLTITAQAQGTMDFSGATTLMTTFKVFAMYAGAVICLGGLIFAGIRMMSGRFQDAIPGLFGALFGAGVLGWGAGWIGSLTGQSM